jgi:hypothetical protein
MSDAWEPQVLIPFHRSEVLSVAEAAAIAGKKVRTLRDWCLRHDIGRRIGGQWAVSRVALAMLLDGDREALGAYLAGDRVSPPVTKYFARCDVHQPKLCDKGIVTDVAAPRRSVIGSKLPIDGPNV